MERLVESAAAGAVGLLGAAGVLAYALRGAADRLATALALEPRGVEPRAPAPPPAAPSARRVDPLPPLREGGVDLDGGLP